MTGDMQCKAVVYRRDTYRRTGRGRNGFEMHYERGRCTRAAADGMPLCRQHAAISDRRFVLTTEGAANDR